MQISYTGDDVVYKVEKILKNCKRKKSNNRADNVKPKIDVTVVTPTQDAMDQAKNEIKQEKIINNSNKATYHQL